ncbi:protein kinase [bacterium]|nr:protein kinase [bacterium]
MVEDPGTDVTGNHKPVPEEDPGSEVTLDFDAEGGFVDDADSAARPATPPPAASTPLPMQQPGRRTPPPPPPPPPPGRTPVPPTRTGSSSSGLAQSDPGATEAMQRGEAPGVGRRLGDFTLEKKIGQGGMGEVYRARQISLDRPVAVKVLPRTLATMPGFIDRFQREAKAAANIIHPHVIQIYAYGIEDGTPYFAMEFVEGEDLQQRMRRMRRLTLEETVDTTIAVASALAVAHEKGVIHRDVKPSNVMIDRQGNVKVMDFGLAKAASTGTELTQSGIILGTPNYISPEQGRGDQLDGRADLYSLGVMFYELLTGTLPFTSDSPAGLIFKHVYEPPEPPRKRNADVPPFLEEVALKLLAKDPGERYADGKALLYDLREFMDNEDYYLSGGARRTPTETDKRRRSSLTTPSGRTVAAQRVDDTTAEGAESFDQDAQTRQLERVEESEQGAIGNAITEEMPRGKTLAPPPRSSAGLVGGVLAFVAVAGIGFFGYTQWKKSQEQGDGGGGGGTIDPSVPKVSLVFGPAEIWEGSVATIQAQGKASAILSLEARKPRELAPGNYQLTVERRGYKKIDKPITLRDDGNHNAVLFLTETGGRFKLADAYEPTDELKRSYADGEAAFQRGDLNGALAAYKLARDTDPGYSPSADKPTALQRYEETQRAISESDKNRETDAQAFKEAEDFKAKKIWRELQRRAEPRKADPKWAGLLEVALAHIKEADQIVRDIEAAVSRGDFGDASSKLQDLEAGDPDNPRRDEIKKAIASSMEERAAAFLVAQNAIKGTEVLPLEQAKAGLDAYLAHAAKDEGARMQLGAVEARLAEARNQSAEGPLVDAMKKEDWKVAAEILARIEQANPRHSKLKEWREKVDDGLHVLGVKQAIEKLDLALPRADEAPDEVLKLLDPQAPGFAEEQKALRELKEARAKILRSRHRDVKVDLKPSANRSAFTADVRSVWDLELEVEGERLKVSREHTLSLAGDKDWKFTRFTLKDE